MTARPSVAAPALEPEEAAEVAAGRCTCGCGEALPVVESYYGDAAPHKHARYASNVCKQRAYRRRVKRGTVTPAHRRKAMAMEERAAELHQQAARVDAQIQYLRQAAARLRREAGELSALAAGQLQILVIK